jgi:tripartite-type tricarboxylate transporter receptor subunit TctC
MFKIGFRILQVLLVAALPLDAPAQNFPVRPIRAIVGYGAGGVTDIVARVTADEMGKHLGQAVIVENRPGASASVAANAVKIAAPDGYTLYSGSTSAFTPVFLKNGSIEPARDLSPISMLGAGDWFVYVPADLPIKSLKDLVAYSKANAVRFASPSVVNTMLMAVAGKRLGFNFETINYKATDQTITAMLSGDAQVTLNAAAGFSSFLSAGKLRVISTLSGKRIDIMPDVPTAIEQGLSLETYSQLSLWAPLNTPGDVINKLNAAAVATLATPAVIEKMRNVSYNAVSSSPAELVRRTEADFKLLSEAAAITGFQPQ